MPGISKTALRLRDRHVFMWQSLEILSVFNTFTLKWIFWKTNTLFKNYSSVFQSKVLRLKTQHFHTKVLSQSIANFKTNKMGSTKEQVLLVTILCFRKFYFSLRTSYKVLIWCTNHPNVHIHTSRWSFIWGCFFFVSILNLMIVKPLAFFSSIVFTPEFCQIK